MPNTQVNSIRLGPWVEGMKPDFGSINISPQAAHESLNIDFLADGSLRKRRGYVKWSTSDPVGMAAGTELWSWTHISTTEGQQTDYFFYADVDSELYYVDTSGTTLARAQSAGPTNLSLGASNKAFAALNNVAYFTSRGTGITALSFDGTTWTTISDGTLNGSGSEFPRASFLINKHDRLFAANVVNGSTRHESRVWWSDPGAATTWGGNSWIDIKPDSGQTITGMVSYGEGIVIFKNESFYLLSGTDPDTFTVYEVSADVGLVGTQAYAEVEGQLIWYDHRTNGIYAFNGAEFGRIDDPIREFIRDGKTVGSAPNVVRAFSFEGKFYLTLPWGGSGSVADHTFVYDVRRDRWTHYDVGFNAITTQGGSVYGVGPAHDAESAGIGIYKLFGSTQRSDDGEDIACHFETGWLPLSGDFFTDFRVRKIQVYMPGRTSSDDTTLDIETHINFSGSTSKTAQASNLSTNDYAVTELAGLDETVKAVQIHIDNDSSDEWRVDAIDLLVSGRMKDQGVSQGA